MHDKNKQKLDEMTGRKFFKINESRRASTHEIDKGDKEEGKEEDLENWPSTYSKGLTEV